MRIDVIADKEKAAEIRAKIKEAGGHCPCKIIRNEDTKCMCREFIEQEDGLCSCGLYRKIKEPEDDI